MVNLFVCASGRAASGYLSRQAAALLSRIGSLSGKGVLTGVWGGGISAAPLWLDGLLWLVGLGDC
jgi:hypothetical protein